MEKATRALKGLSIEVIILIVLAIIILLNLLLILIRIMLNLLTSNSRIIYPLVDYSFKLLMEAQVYYLARRSL